MCNRGRNPKEKPVNVTINNVDSGFRWENRYAKWPGTAGAILFLGSIMLLGLAGMAANYKQPTLATVIAVVAAVCLVLCFLATGPNPWARTAKGLDKRRHTRDFALEQFWHDRGFAGVGKSLDIANWVATDMDQDEPGISQVFQGLEVWEHPSSGLRVRFATYRVPNFGPRDVTVGFMGVFILSLDNYIQKTLGPTEILRIEELEGSPCVATLITDFPPEVLRAVLNRFGDKFPYMFGGADGFIEPSDLIDAIVPQVAKEPKKGPPDLKLVPAT